jgi:hypothetical protein
MLLDGALWEDIAINFQVLTQYGTSFDYFFCFAPKLYTSWLV